MVVTTVHNTFGAAFFGVTASSFVFGIFSMQCYSYYNRYPQDRRFYKILVAVLWLLEAVHSFCSAHFFYHYVIEEWGNSLVVATQPIIWTLGVQVVASAIVGTIVKACFAMRVWRFSGKNVWITAAIVVPTLAQLGFSVWFTVAGLRLPSLTNLDDIFMVAIISLGLGVLTDIFTAATMAWYLGKLRTGYKRSDTLVNKLVAYSINTGLLTGAFSVACLVTYGTMPKTFIFIALYFVLSKLYANSFLATLNTRLVLKGRGTDNAHETVPTFIMVGANTISPPLRQTSNEIFEAAGKLESAAEPPPNGPSFPHPLQLDVYGETRVREDTHPRGTSRNTPAHPF